MPIVLRHSCPDACMSDVYRMSWTPDGDSGCNVVGCAAEGDIQMIVNSMTHDTRISSRGQNRLISAPDRGGKITVDTMYTNYQISGCI